MKYAALIVTILLFTSFNIQQKNDPYYNKQKHPSSWGIDTYIKNNEKDLIAEYEYRIDTIYDVYLFTENLSEVGDGDLGNFYLPDYIIITNEERYVEYEYKNLTKYQQKVIPYVARTVKAVVFHELTHAYFNQILIIAKQNGKKVSPEYGNIRIFPNPGTRFGAEFIEEGVCEYVVYYLHESSQIRDIPAPENENELMDSNNKVNIVYGYSVIFLNNFLDKYGVKRGIEILITNRPPDYQEILNPSQFYNRLIIDEKN